MASNIRRGVIPRATQGISEYLDEMYTLDGFFGDYVHLFRKHNPAFPKRWSSDELMYCGLDTNHVESTDRDDPAGTGVELLRGEGIIISISHRSEAAGFAERNADFHQIRFYHRGEFTLETELGSLDVVPGEFVVIPKGIIYRELPKTTDNAVLVFETAAAVTTAEALWDSVGFASTFIDYSAMKLPEPSGEDREQDTEVRVKFDGKILTLVYDFDPCHDVVGWVGDPVVFAMDAWKVPGLGSSHGFLTPPAGAVLMARDKSFFFNVMTPKPFPSVPAPDGSFGAPGHLNDFDEVWFNHAADTAPHTDGALWRMPPSIPHPGIKRPPEYPENPVAHIRELKINFDTRATLAWTDVAKEHFIPDPQISLYTSMAGTHIGVVPEEALKHARGGKPKAATTPEKETATS